MKIYVKKVKNVKGKVKESLWIDFRDNNGDRQRKPLKLLNTKENREKAELIKAQLLIRLKDGQLSENSVPTLSEYKVKSFEMNKSRRRTTTQNDYEISFKKHIEPYLGHMKLDKIKAADLELWQNKVLETVSAARLKNIRAVLSGILKDAYRDELIPKSPLSLVKTIKVPKAEIRPFTISEIMEIIQKSQGQARSFLALAFFTGMRSGEMVGLKWNDIDLKKLEINIRRSRKMGADTFTKTMSSVRSVDILEVLLPYLKEQYERTGEHNSYVFLDKKNKPLYDIKRIRETDWKKTLKACNFDYRPIYHTRHTFATMMLENGEDILWVSNMLGHTDSSMTLSRYARYIKQDDKKRGQFLAIELTLNDTEIGTELLKTA